MSDEAGRGWVLFELPQPTSIHRIAWSRDRDGKLTDRLPTAYTIEAGESLDSMETLATVFPKRPAIQSTVNTDRIAPVSTQTVRFTIESTNNLEPCIDELEIFTTDGKNVALATAGATIQSSGDSVTPDRHELRFINDGNYGNSRSWMSNEVGKGWIEVKLAQPYTIDRIRWGRDRNAQFSDRTPTTYRIEIQNDAGQWNTVADSSDRYSAEESEKRKALTASFAGLPPRSPPAPKS